MWTTIPVNNHHRFQCLAPTSKEFAVKRTSGTRLLRLAPRTGCCSTAICVKRSDKYNNRDQSRHGRFSVYFCALLKSVLGRWRQHQAPTTTTTKTEVKISPSFQSQAVVVMPAISRRARALIIHHLHTKMAGGLAAS